VKDSSNNKRTATLNVTVKEKEKLKQIHLQIIKQVAAHQMNK
jgi:hypothetical protein